MLAFITKKTTLSPNSIRLIGKEIVWHGFCNVRYEIKYVPEFRYGHLTGQRAAHGIESILETDKKVGVSPHPDLRVRIPPGTQYYFIIDLVMNYEKAYKEILGVVKELYPSMSDYQKEKFDGICSELKESEDERIRKHIIEVFKERVGYVWKDGTTNDECLAYLEKKKEQNLEDIEDKAVRKYMKLDKFALANMLAERDKTNAEVIEAFESIEQKPAEWSEEDEYRFELLMAMCEDEQNGSSPISTNYREMQETKDWLKNRFKFLRPRSKQESEPMKIKFAGKIYKVYGTKELPGGILGYIIEDEHGLYDCIIHPDEVLGGYGIKSNGSPYPTKDIAFSGQPAARPQPKAELTLLDENIIKAAVAFVEQNDHFNCWGGIDKHTVIKALRSLKPHWKQSLATVDLENDLCYIQDNYSDGSHEYKVLGEAIEFIRSTESHWKPSKEQISALKVVAHGYPSDDLNAIESLLNDLQKL